MLRYHEDPIRNKQTGCYQMIKKHGRYYWLDIWIEGKRVRRSLKTTKLCFVKQKSPK